MISIVMPVKNAEDYLAYCIDSIIKQTHSEWELIAVNDHSEDSTSQILTHFAKEDPRIKWTNNEGVGIIHALRTAYAQTSGDYITRMDADDLMSEDKLWRMLALLEEAGPNHLVTGFVEYFSDQEVGEGYRKYASWLNALSDSEDNFSEIYKECVIPSPCWLVSRNDFDTCGGFLSDRYPEDYDLCFRFRESGLQIKSVKKTIHLWRDHSTRASRNDPNYADNRFLNLKLYHFLKSDYDAKRELVIWGAGKKAKKIVQFLQANQIPLRWICNNRNKIGRDIYHITLESDDIISQVSHAQLVIAVANPQEQEDIKETLSKLSGNEVFFFC